MTFGQAFDCIKDSEGMWEGGIRLPHWPVDVFIKCQFPDENSKMTEPYLYSESTLARERVPWIPTNNELFSEDWDVIRIRKGEKSNG